MNSAIYSGCDIPGKRGQRDSSHIRLSYVLPVYLDGPYIFLLEHLLRTYNAYSRDILDRVQFVIVDDGSPTPVSIPHDIDLNILLLRINEDIPWTQPGARNLGVVYSRSDKVLLTDLDHQIPEQTFAYVLKMRNPKRAIFRMRRIDERGCPIKPHPNTFVLSRARFLLYYGYDEDFSGHYGFDDTMFRRWQRNHGTRFLYLPSSCFCRTQRNSTICGHHLKRDLAHNRTLAQRKKQLWKEFGPEVGHSRRFLDFS